MNSEVFNFIVNYINKMFRRKFIEKRNRYTTQPVGNPGMPFKRDKSFMERMTENISENPTMHILKTDMNVQPIGNPVNVEENRPHINFGNRPIFIDPRPNKGSGALKPLDDRSMVLGSSKQEIRL